MSRDERDPAAEPEWRPVSSEWARRAALEACERAIRDAKDRDKTAGGGA